MQITAKRFCRWHVQGGSCGLGAERGLAPRPSLHNQGRTGGMIDPVACHRARCGGVPVGQDLAFLGRVSCCVGILRAGAAAISLWGRGR
jgi:hypothetical protein